MSKSIYEELREDRLEQQKAGLLPEWFTTNGYQAFKTKYLWQADSFKEQVERIAKTAARHMPRDKEGWESKFFNVIWKGWLALSTPVLANMGTDRGCTVSCAGGYITDSVYGFYTAQVEAAVLSQNGFGTSGYLGDIRPRGSKITGGGKASGVVPVFKDFVQLSRDISQGGLRRGSWAGYVPIDHSDFWELSDHILNNPDDANVGWIVTDLFIERLNNNDQLAHDIFKKALKLKCVTGKGYFWFVDKVNRANPECYKANNLLNKASNLCSEIALFSDKDHGFTCQPSFAEVLDKDNRIITFGDLVVGDLIQSSSGLTKVVNKVSSGVKEVYKYTTNSGSFIGTEDHRIVQKGIKVEVKDATSIDKGLVSFNRSDVSLNWDAVVNGLLTGDGTYRNGENQLCVGEKDEDYFNHPELTKKMQEISHDFIWRIENDLPPLCKTYERFIPEKIYRGDYSDKSSFLLGLFSANGSVRVTPENKSNDYIVLKQTSYTITEQVRSVLFSLGIDSSIYKQKGKLTQFSNGEYHTKDSYHLIISSNASVSAFMEMIGFLQSYKKPRIDEPKRGSRPISAKIISKEYLGKHEVFHIEVDNEDHTYITDGLNVSNCVLSSMNLARYDEWKDTDAVYTSTVFLDCVASEFINQAEDIAGMEPYVRFTKKGRALGLGTLGFHTYLQQNNIAIEELEAGYKNHEIYSHLNKESLKASEWMAKELGEPEWCKGFGVRNTHRIAIAPNTSSALICGSVSQGIEPIYQNVYTQGSASGEMSRINPVLVDVMKERGVFNDKIIDSIIKDNGSIRNQAWLTDHEKLVFKTAFEIDQKILLRLASQRQPYICQAQSLNLFVSADESEEYIAELHRIAFMDKNIKSLYYLRSLAGVYASKDECLSCEG